MFQPVRHCLLNWPGISNLACKLAGFPALSILKQLKASPKTQVRY